jgi:hypothetical protein
MGGALTPLGEDQPPISLILTAIARQTPAPSGWLIASILPAIASAWRSAASPKLRSIPQADEFMSASEGGSLGLVKVENVWLNAVSYLEEPRSGRHVMVAICFDES